VPLADPSAIASLKFSEPVVLVRPPFRAQFAYAGTDGRWQPTWLGVDKLPRSVRVTVRDAVSGVTLAVSSAVTIHVDIAPECANAQSKNCANAAAPAAAATAPTATAPNSRQQ
jgi:general secretion pathway protein J